MARTPLMRALQQLAGEYSEATKRGISVDQVREERQAAFNRRAFLKGAGAVMAGAAIISPIGLGRVMKAVAATLPRIGIVGAGIAGVNAALTLHDAGFASTVYEASSRIGGRMHSNTTNWANGQSSEWCGEFIDSDHSVILGLLQRFGLKTRNRLPAENKLHDPQFTYFFFDHYYLQNQAVIDFGPVYATLQEQLNAAPFPTLYNQFTSKGYELDHTSVYEWIERYIPGGHGSNFGQLMDVAYNIEYGRDTNEQSSLNLIYLLGFQPSSTGLSIFGTSDELYEIVGGNQQLPTAIANSLPDGSIKLKWRLIAVAQDKQEVTLTFSTPDGIQHETFDQVILTLPFSVLRGLDYSNAGFNSLKKTAITQLGYGTNSKLQLQFDDRFWNGTGPWPGNSTGDLYTDLSLQNAWDGTVAQSGKTGIIVNYTGGHIGASFDPDQPYTNSDSPLVQHYARELLDQLDEIWPGVSQHYNGNAALSYPTGDPYLLGSYSCWLTGQYTLFSGYERKRQGNIHFGGEHCSINFQGFMEGGAEEGARAANEIIKDYVAPSKTAILNRASMAAS